jgi:hypothetical protein
MRNRLYLALYFSRRCKISFCVRQSCRSGFLFQWRWKMVNRLPLKNDDVQGGQKVIRTPSFSASEKLLHI